MSEHAPKEIRIHIDRQPYEAPGHTVTGAQLRALPSPPIAEDFSLWLEERGDVEDQLIAPHDSVHIKKDMHFYSAPTKINPGR
jgi:hypothetical protein